MGGPSFVRDVRCWWRMIEFGVAYARSTWRLRHADPIAIASFNKKVTNRLTAPFAGHLPGFAVVRHRGRTSGRITGRRSTPSGGVTTMSS